MQKVNFQEEVNKERERMLQPYKKMTCSECHQEFVLTVGEKEFYEMRKLHEPHRCQKCRAAHPNTVNRGQVAATCSRCNKEFMMPENVKKAILAKGHQVQCDECRAVTRRENAVVETRECVTCKKKFNITQKMKEEIEAKNGKLPTHCPACQHKWRIKRAAMDSVMAQHGLLHHKEEQVNAAPADNTAE